MASVTITTDAGQDARLVPAFTDKLKPVDGGGNPRNATAADVKAWLIAELQAVVRDYEYRQAQAAIVTSSFSPT